MHTRPMMIPLILSTGLLLPALASSDSGLISRIEGYYSAPARLCTVPEGNQLVPCDPPVNDCMQVKKIDDSHARIHVSSVQENGSECGIDGVAELHGKSLRFIGKDSGYEVDVVFEHGKITFKYVPELTAPVRPFCGAQGRLDWVSFELKDRKPLNFASCAEPHDP
jgi:hypothetical protein